MHASTSLNNNSAINPHNVPDKSENAFSRIYDTSYQYNNRDINTLGEELIDNLSGSTTKFCATYITTIPTTDGKSSSTIDIKTMSTALKQLLVNNTSVVGIYHKNNNHWISYVVTVDISTPNHQRFYVHIKDSLATTSHDDQKFNDFITQALGLTYTIQSIGSDAEQKAKFEPNGIHSSCGIFALRNMEVMARLSLNQLNNINDDSFFRLGENANEYSNNLKKERMLLGDIFIRTHINSLDNSISTNIQAYISDYFHTIPAHISLWFDENNTWLSPSPIDLIRSLQVSSVNAETKSTEDNTNDPVDALDFSTACNIIEIGDQLFSAVELLDLPKLQEIIDTQTRLKNEDLLNSRKNGINILGLVLLQLKGTHIEKNRDLINNAVQAIVNCQLFHINEYVVKGKYQNVTHKTQQDPAYEIAGMNALHASIRWNLKWLYDILMDRNKTLKTITAIKNTAQWHDLFVNIHYPLTHPQYHMFSPTKLIEKLHTPTIPRTKWMHAISSSSHDNSTYPDDWSDSSGDSDDENSRAFTYKKWITDLHANSATTSNTNPHTPVKQKNSDSSFSSTVRTPQGQEINHIGVLNSPPSSEKKHAQAQREAAELASQMDIAHYHGMPIMRGLFSSAQQFDTAKEIIQSINVETSSTKKNNNFLLSRTLATSSHIENIRMFLKMPEAQNKVKEINESISIILTSMQGQVPPDDFQRLLSIFVRSSTINNDKKNKNHLNFWLLITSFCKKNATLKPHLDKIIQYRFPFLSTSKTPDHAVKYGSGQHLENDRGETGIEPGYNSDGRPKHRLAGFVYVMCSDYISHSTGYSTHHHDLSHHHVNGNMRSINNSKTKASLDRTYFPQFEVTYLNPIHSNQIIAAIPILYPNFKKPFNAYYKEKLGYTLSNYQCQKSKAVYYKARQIINNLLSLLLKFSGSRQELILLINTWSRPYNVAIKTIKVFLNKIYGIQKSSNILNTPQDSFEDKIIQKLKNNAVSSPPNDDEIKLIRLIDIAIQQASSTMTALDVLELIINVIKCCQTLKKFIDNLQHLDAIKKLYDRGSQDNEETIISMTLSIISYIKKSDKETNLELTGMIDSAIQTAYHCAFKASGQHHRLLVYTSAFNHLHVVTPDNISMANHTVRSSDVLSPLHKTLVAGVNAHMSDKTPEDKKPIFKHNLFHNNLNNNTSPTHLPDRQSNPIVPPSSSDISDSHFDRLTSQTAGVDDITEGLASTRVYDNNHEERTLTPTSSR